MTLINFFFPEKQSMLKINKTAKIKGKAIRLYFEYIFKSKESKEISALVTPQVGQGILNAVLKRHPNPDRYDKAEYPRAKRINVIFLT